MVMLIALIVGRKWKTISKNYICQMFTRSIVLIFLCIAPPVFTAGPPPKLEDAFLDHFAGDWSVVRKMGNGRTADTTVHGEWVLKHHFIELHYGAGENSPEYEALVLIGFDDVTRTYVCYWMDVFGGRYSGVGRGKLDPLLLGIEFRFDFQDGPLTNRFRFDQGTKSWTSIIRQEESGQWKTFAEEKWTRK
jgi:hypothetical protein